MFTEQCYNVTLTKVKHSKDYSSDNLWEDTGDKGVEEGGGNRSEQQHVSHQGPSGGRPRHRSGHTYAVASSPCVTLTLFFTDLTTFLSNNIYQQLVLYYG